MSTLSNAKNMLRRKKHDCILIRIHPWNHKCNLCDISEWKDNIDELLEIAASGKATVLSPKEKAIDTLENFIENPDRAALNDEFVEALNLAVEKMKEVK